MKRRNFGWRTPLTLSCLVALAAGCSAGTPPETGPDASGKSDAGQSEADLQLLNGMPNGAWESSYKPLDVDPVLIRGGTVMTAAGEEIEGGDVLRVDGSQDGMRGESQTSLRAYRAVHPDGQCGGLSQSVHTGSEVQGRMGPLAGR